MDGKPSRKDLSHERIVEVAARAIRRSGYAGTGVADIMKEAGLTHGGFYAHFASRSALLAAAVERAGRNGTERVTARLAERQREPGVSALRALVEGYLSDSHLAATEEGCVVAALCSEMPRQAPEVRAASAVRVQGLIERVRDALPPGVPAAQAGVIAASLVGGLQLARALAVDDAATARAQALLQATRDSLLERYDAP